MDAYVVPTFAFSIQVILHRHTITFCFQSLEDFRTTGLTWLHTQRKGVWSSKNELKIQVTSHVGTRETGELDQGVNEFLCEQINTEYLLSASIVENSS